MTFAREVVTASILNSRARFHRVRAERFGLHASSSNNPDSRMMYLQLAARETALADRLEQQPPKTKQTKSPAAIPTGPEESRGPRPRFRFRVGSMPDVSVRATVARANDGYAVAVLLEKNGQVHSLTEKTVVGRVEAETVAIKLAALHGVPWHKVEVLYR
jgi:hypothetical protein